MKLKKIILFATILASYSMHTIACSVFMYSDNYRTLFGNNEDSPIGEEAVLTFVPPSKNKLGYFFIKLQNIPNPLIANYPQGGMNEKGVAYDITATPLKNPIELIIPQNTPYPDGNLMEKVLADASSVDQAVEIIKTYKASEEIRKKTGLSEFRQMQVFLSDAQGNAAVVGIGKDGKLAVTHKTENYHLVTNFSLLQPENSLVEENLRYNIAKKMLSKLKSPTIEGFKSILSAIHVEGIAATLYSTIYDLQSQDIYIYNFHNYQSQKKINLREEMLKGKHSITLKSLFKDQPTFAIHSMKELVSSFNSMKSLYLKAEADLKACKEDAN